MKKSLPIFLILVLSLLVGLVSFPVNATVGGVSCNGLGATVSLDNSGKQLDTAKSVILYEMNTDTLVYGYDADRLTDPTGLVKILTVLVALEHGDISDMVTVKQSTLNTVAVGSVSARLKAGEEISLEDLLYSLGCVIVIFSYDVRIQDS
jgi:D-alanyl-D-alanine carboxypeptidase